jgi:hypothetical protein
MSRVRRVRTRHPDTMPISELPISKHTLPKRSNPTWLARLQSLCAGAVFQMVTTGAQRLRPLQSWQPIAEARPLGA